MIAAAPEERRDRIIAVIAALAEVCRHARRRPSEAGAEAEIEITALGLAGDGIGHLEGHTVFVPYAAPGDRLRIRLEGEGEGGWRARILERLADGADRAEAPCPAFRRLRRLQPCSI